MRQTILFILFFCSIFVLKAEEKEPYLVKTKNFHVQNFSIKKIDLGITAVIYNPYKAKVTIDEILIDVFIGDKKLGTITEAAEDVKIKKESAFDLPLQIQVNTGSTVAKFFTEGMKMLLLGKSVKVDYKGYIKVKALGFIPVKVKIDQSAYFTAKDILNDGDEKPANTIAKDATKTKTK
ncbi:MAG TPA: LEA type 2 family protein [Chitinophagales bacterium]|nr:LEA type 2 family protein [Chitinophagales bacterium]